MVDFNKLRQLRDAKKEGNGYLSFPDGWMAGSPAYVAHEEGHVGGGAECCVWCAVEEAPPVVGMTEGAKGEVVSQEDGSLGMVADAGGDVNLGEWDVMDELKPPPVVKPKEMAKAKDGVVVVTIPKWLMEKKELLSPKLEGVVVRATEAAILFKGHVLLRPAKHCHRCGLEITNPVSQLVGYGPVCSEYLGIPRDVGKEELERYKREAMERTLWEGWLPKSRIEIEELGEKGRYGGY